MTAVEESELAEEVQALLKRDEKDTEIKLYNYRWWILTLYSIVLYTNTGSWLCLFTITDATAKFYNVKASNLLLVFNISTVAQLLVATPMSFLPAKAGLRPTMCAAAVVNAIGAILFAVAADRDHFPFFIAGQVVLAIPSTVLPQLAPEISAIWFGEHERATATSIGVQMARVGAAVGFLQPALLVGNGDINNNFSLVANNIRVVIYTQTALCLLALALVLIFFKDKPETPPSVSEAHHHGAGDISFAEYKTSFKILFQDRNYLLAANSYAAASAICVAVPITLNQMIAWKCPHHDATVGWMGFTGIVAGTISSVLVGILLDKTHRFKLIAVTACSGAFTSWIAFSLSLGLLSSLTLSFIFFVTLLITFFPVEPILADMMSEMTYPVSSGLAYVLAVTIGRFYMIIEIYLASMLIDKKKHVGVLIAVGIAGAASLVLSALVKVSGKRTRAEQAGTIEFSESDDLPTN